MINQFKSSDCKSATESAIDVVFKFSTRACVKNDPRTRSSVSINRDN